MSDYERIILDDGSALLIYKVMVPDEWRWTLRNSNIESLRGGLLAASQGGFPTQQAAKEDFFMHNDYDDKRDQKAPWGLIVFLVFAIAAMLALVSYSNRARAHDMYEGWKVNGQNCCHDVHCFPTKVKKFPDGVWRVLDRDGTTWLPIEENQIDFTSPFPGSHGCVAVDPDDGEHTAICAAVGGSA